VDSDKRLTQLIYLASLRSKVNHDDYFVEKLRCEYVEIQDKTLKELVCVPQKIKDCLEQVIEGLSITEIWLDELHTQFILLENKEQT